VERLAGLNGKAVYISHTPGEKKKYSG